MTREPDLQEKYLYCESNKLLFYIPSLLSTITLLAGIFLFSISHPSLIWFLAYFLILLFYLGLSFSVGIFSKEFNILEYESNRRKPDKLPSIDIFLPSCGEDLGVVRRTIAAAVIAARSYRDEGGKAFVYVLDDANRDDLKQYSEKACVYYIRRENNHLKKAGNLRNAFSRTSGDWILILDADFVPREDMLTELVENIEEDVAIIQTPQFFRIESHMSWIEKGAGFVQELFYRLIQVNRNHFGAPVCVGTCALYRRTALARFGGTAPIEYSEDVHTGVAVMSMGWRVKYLPINFAAGECPKTIKSYFTQQYRWCMGSITLMVNRDFWRAPAISLMQKACFATGMLYYIATAIGIFSTAIPALIVLWFLPELAHWHSIMFSVPSLLIGTLVIAEWSRHRWGFYAIGARLLSYWSHLFAIIDKARGKLIPWVPTGNVKKVSRYTHFKWAYLFYVCLLISALIGGIIKNYENLEILPMCAVALFYRAMDVSTLIRIFKEDLA